MSSGGVEKMPPFRLDCHNGPRETQWLAENLEGVDQSVKAILNLIKDDGFSPEQKDMSYEKKPELIARVEGLHHMYRSLAERYDHLSKVVNAQKQNKVVSHSASSQDSLLVTPNQKLGPNKYENQAVGFNLSPSSGHGSSDFSDKGGSEISFSASDSESEAFYSVANKTSDLHVNLQENETCTTLLRRVAKYEEELKESNRKLCFSDKEIARLKDELEKLRRVSTLVDNLQDGLRIAQREITILDGDLETEKTIVLKLQGEVAGFEAMAETEKRLVLQLKERILGHEADAYEREQEIKKLNITLFDTRRIFSLEKAKLNCDISIMSEQLTLLKTRVEESEARNEFLENEIRQYEAEKLKTERMYKEQLIRSCGEIEKLKADISERSELVEVLNKDFDKLKVKYDMLVAEKDGLSAKVQTLEAEMSSRFNVIRQLEEKLSRVNMEHISLMAGSDHAKELVDKLSVRVVELEREAEKQRVVISERGEEKREAIRQLCFSIEHYRNDCQELKKAIVGHRRAIVLAS